MAPRTSWKGHLRLSLVSVPVKAYTATDSSAEIRLNQLHEECNSRVKYKKVCPEHGELQSSDIVSGYEYAKDQYVIIKPEEIAKLRKQPDKSVHIEGFFPEEQLDPRFHAGKTYYLLPDGVAGDKPYALLHDGMESASVHAIARAVLSGREQLVLLRPMGQIIVLSVLQWAKAVKDPAEFEDEFEGAELTDEERALTQTLISASLIDNLDPSAYHDGYTQDLEKLIQALVEGKEIVEAPQAEAPAILNLMDALKRSVAAAQASGDAVKPAKKAAGSKAAPSKKAASSKKAPAKKKAAPSATTKKKAASRKKKSG